MTPEDRARGLHHLAEAPASAWKELVATVDRLVESGAPLRTLLIALSPRDELESTEAIRWSVQWAKERRSGILLLSGDPGVGKSVAAARYVISSNTLRAGVAWVQAPSLGLDDFAAAYRRLQRLTRVPCLVLDELGGQGSTSLVAVERIANLITGRHAAGRPTVITSNKNIEEIAQIYDGCRAEGGKKPSDKSRIADRIRENGRYVHIQGSTSFRRGGAGASPHSRGNRYRIAKRGCYLFDVLAAGATDTFLLDELQDMLCLDDAAVAEAAARTGYTPSVLSMVSGLLNRKRLTPCLWCGGQGHVHGKHGGTFCSQNHADASQRAIESLLLRSLSPVASVVRDGDRQEAVS